MNSLVNINLYTAESQSEDWLLVTTLPDNRNQQQMYPFFLYVFFSAYSEYFALWWTMCNLYQCNNLK